MASGMPSSRAQTLSTALAFSAESRNPGFCWRARWTKSVTASAAPAPGATESGGTR